MSIFPDFVLPYFSIYHKYFLVFEGVSVWANKSLIAEHAHIREGWEDGSSDGPNKKCVNYSQGIQE